MNRMWSIRGLFLLLFTLAAHSAVVSVRVYDAETARAIAGASVKVYDRGGAGSLLRSGTTDQDGRCSLLLPSTEPAVLAVCTSVLGYQTDTTIVTVGRTQAPV